MMVGTAEIYKKEGDVMLTAKAYNGRVILAWLDETLYAASQDQHFASLDPRTLLISAALKLDSLNHWFQSAMSCM